MKWLVAIWLLLSVGIANAQTPTATPTPLIAPPCTLTGYITQPDGSMMPNGVITFNSQKVQVVNNVPIAPVIVSTQTDSTGAIRPISLPQGLVVQVTVCPQTAGCSAPFSAFVKYSSSADFGQLAQGIHLTLPGPPGAPPMVIGYSANSVVEGETVGGDLTFARTGAQTYNATVTKLNGTTPGGTCTPGQLVSSINSSGVPLCTSPLTGTTDKVGFNFVGNVAPSVIQAFTCPYALTIPANFLAPNSVASCGTNPAETDAYTVKVNGTAIGNISLNTSCVASLGSAAQTTCGPGQRMEVDAPATVSGGNIAITIAVTR